MKNPTVQIDIDLVVTLLFVDCVCTIHYDDDGVFFSAAENIFPL